MYLSISLYTCIRNYSFRKKYESICNIFYPNVFLLIIISYVGDAQCHRALGE